MPTITVNTGYFKGKQYESLLDLLGDQERLRRRCKHPVKCREVIYGRRGLRERTRSWVSVICSRCKTTMELHETPPLTTKLPKWKERED